MYYEWEWLSDIAIIPAFECFTAGFIAATLLWFGMWLWEERHK